MVYILYETIDDDFVQILSKMGNDETSQHQIQI